MTSPESRKLIIQVPCYNEEESLRATLQALPRSVSGFDIVEILVIDDGSRDATAKIARECGVEHLVSFGHNQGLAKAFMAGVEASLIAGADVIVNTDADNQYAASSIEDLVRPIVDGTAQIVVGARPIAEVREFSFLKKLLQWIGSAVVRLASGTQVPDAPSGFRAFHRDAAMRFYVFGNYTYTLETIIQAGRKNIPITSVPIRVNPVARPSRLVKSSASYVYRSVLSILRIFVLYKPLRFFLVAGTVFLVPGTALGIRFIYLYVTGDGSGHVQSLILAAVLILTAIIVYAVGLLSDLTAANRALLEDVRMRMLRREILHRQGRQA
ncbi:MAG: glycosyltransferase family 2 protein [Steroidobacteraceae bacterium]